jgi:hypothetical protein
MIRGNDQFPYFWINKKELHHFKRHKVKNLSKNNVNNWKSYEGQWDKEENQPDGIGIMNYNDGSKYEGEWE